ncbi:MAG: hypothetical protein JGK03_02635 [Microcoleus sp. PH2017_25_DOB_D_A]|uniref:hypothetical protein n=1 Tax=unclassified Microcoleus TaxID=2642155 RepID=UPI001E02AA5A|nr:MULTISPECIES: hypothetical protein [unclassified Microcoleus]TAE16216.1 MAG: hypothetical protein EAZ94_01720 [Oscillatoriales cyanobacterium]MCC3489609.1 hypothetical protein [Microcoleus sp. PH2017_16_JOR_D_A]MCC3533111.1 hypothetical protein [Microcoleus sp. PH2017_25_DOB_D_A]MCC3545536.1 hypothetical protein [Microcoleus sp. PH2017_24_DOB_U_A]MCC3570454.1 hypothetical protein [Microcoleus sp. PH2017_34_RAT_O_A]
MVIKSQIPSAIALIHSSKPGFSRIWGFVTSIFLKNPVSRYPRAQGYKIQNLKSKIQNPIARPNPNLAND